MATLKVTVPLSEQDIIQVKNGQPVKVAFDALPAKTTSGRISNITVAANKAVQVDLALAILLVALVMLVFLHSLRNAFIILVAIPASLISTFVFMYAFGFSLNMMTLLAMSLVVGILVDDAIVVLDNIHRHLELGKNSYRAAVDGRNEIGFTAMAITMVDVVVFLPLVFVEGIAGDIVREFAGVIVVSTLLSLLVCFTLTPMMAARFSKHEKPGRFGNWFERQFAKMENAYGNLLAGSLRRRRWVQIGVFGLFALVMTLPGNGFVGSEFVPSMDKGEIALTVQMPVSATLAMVIGMLPIAIGHGLGGELKRGLGWALIGGLSSSMFLTLVLVPTIYYDFEKLKTWFAKIFKSNRHDDSDDIISDKTLAKSAVATIVVGLIVFFNTGVVAAQDAQKLSMEEAVELVKTKNLLLRASRLEIEKSRLKEKEIRSQRMPAVAMESQLQHNIESPVIFMPNFRIDPATGEFSTGDEYNAIRAYDKNSYSANLTVSTPLINRSIKAAAAATRAEAATYEADLMFETSDKVFETKKLYLQILIAQEQHRLAQASLNRAKETLTDTRGLWKNGAALDLDTLRAFVSVQNLTPNVSKSEKTILVLKETLAAMLDLPSADIELTDKLEFQNYEQAESAARLADMACAQRPEFLQIAAQNSLLDASTRLERTKYLPTLTAFAQGGYNAQSPNLEAWNADWVGSAFTGLKLKVPIFTPTIKPALQQIDVSRKQLSLQKNYLERMVVTEIESAGINLRDARERYGNQQANIAAAERSLQLTKSRWKTGLSKLSDVSDAELALNQSQTNQLQALYDYLIAGIEMEKAIGK